MAFDYFGLGAVLCIGLLVVIIIVFAILWLFFKVLIEFFPSVVIAGLVWWFTRDIVVTIVAFVGSALFFAYLGYRRKRERTQYHT